MTTNKQDPWYADGLQFSCTGCGDCCTGGEGYVWVNEQEMQAIADAIGEPDLEHFKQNFARKVGIRYSLKEYSNGDCYFFDNKTRGCQVYEARPRQCKTWPFWQSNLKSPEDWEETCRQCKGSGTGKLYSLGEIEERRKTVRV